jgi:hypothetical protein
MVGNGAVMPQEKSRRHAWGSNKHRHLSMLPAHLRRAAGQSMPEQVYAVDARLCRVLSRPQALTGAFPKLCWRPGGEELQLWHFASLFGAPCPSRRFRVAQ